MSVVCFLLDEHVHLANIGIILEDLLLIWNAGQPDEFRDQIVYLPL